MLFGLHVYSRLLPVPHLYSCHDVLPDGPIYAKQAVVCIYLVPHAMLPRYYCNNNEMPSVSFPFWTSFADALCLR